MDKELILILGGARSGKSSFAQQLAKKTGGDVVFLATAESGDDEMRDRIARHKAARPATWHTLEEPLELASALERQSRKADVVVIDCITLWLNNIFLKDANPSEAYVLEKVDKLIEVYDKGTANYIIVSGEVGLGLVPPYPLGRVYRDYLGWINQKIAAKADKVFLMVAGIPLELKSLGIPWEMP